MKKAAIFALAILLVLTTALFFACSKGIDGDEFQGVTLSSDGVLSWTQLKRAKKYEILNGKMGTGAQKETTTDCSFDLKKFNLKNGEHEMTLLAIEDNKDLGTTVEAEFAIYQMVVLVANGEYSLVNRNYSDEYITLRGWEDADGTITNYIKPQFYSDLGGATYTSLGKEITINGDNVWTLCKNSDYSDEVVSQTITGLKRGHNYYYIKLNDKNGTFIKGYKLDFYVLQQIEVKLYSVSGAELYSASMWEAEYVDIADLYDKIGEGEYIAYGSDILEKDSAPIRAEKGKYFKAVTAAEHDILQHFDFVDGVLTKKANHSCSGVETLVVPSSILGQPVVKLSGENGSICNVTNLVLNEGIKEIDPAAIGRTLRKINIPDSVTRISCSTYVFDDIETEKDSNGFEYIGKWLVKASSDASGEIRNGTVGIACKFSNSNILLPDSLRYFDNEVFAGITLENSTHSVKRDGFVFNGNWLVKRDSSSSVQPTAIPDNTIGILPHALRGFNVNSLVIPASVKCIASDAFYHSTIGRVSAPADLMVLENGMYLSPDKTIMYLADSTVTEVTIPDTVVEVGPFFTNANALRKVHLGANVKKVEFPSGGDVEISVSTQNKNYISKDRIVYSYTNRQGAETVELMYVPSNLSGKVTLDSRLKSIGMHKFRNLTQLTEVVLPQGLERIEGYAFEGCTALKSVTIPQSVVSIGRGAFADGTTLTFEATDHWYDGMFSENSVDVTDSATVSRLLSEGKDLYRRVD